MYSKYAVIYKKSTTFKYQQQPFLVMEQVLTDSQNPMNTVIELTSSERIMNIVFKEDEITWQTIIYELIKVEGMDPWDINVSLLSEKYIGMLKKLQQMDLRLSGKVVLAAAILLKIKSERFLGEDMAYFDSMMAGDDSLDLDDETDGLVERKKLTREDMEKMRLIPKTPQPRQRKVSVYDLVDALQKALEVKKRRNLLTRVEAQVRMPEKHVDISEIIRNVYDQVKVHFENNDKITFTQLINNSEKREDKIYTFIPLLHLSNQRKVDLLQDQHFGDIDILKANPDVI